MTDRVSDKPTATAIVVAAFGHRNPVETNVDQHFGDICIELERLSDQNPNSEIVLVSSLADGGDRIAARAAMAQDRVRVIACLPFSKEEYTKDFTTESVKEFEQLLEECSEVWELSDSSLEDRQLAYARCAQIMIEVSDLSIAFWDGVETHLQGGTSDSLHKITSPASDPLLQTSAIWLDMPRGDDTRPLRPAMYWSTNTSMWSPDPATLEQQSLKDVLNARLTDNVSFSGSLETLFNLVDPLANAAQGSYRSRIKWLFLSGFVVASTVGTVFTIVMPLSALLMAIASAVLAIQWSSFKKSNLKNQYESYRLLGEVTRLEMMLRASGSSRTVVDDFLVSEGVDGLWMRKLIAFNSLRDRLNATVDMRGDIESAKAWLADQLAYLEGSDGRPGAVERNFKKASFFKRRGAFPLGLAVFALLAQTTMAASQIAVPLWVALAAQLFWEYGLAAGASILGFAEVIGFADAARHLSTKQRLLHQFQVQLSFSQDVVKGEEIIEQVAISSLSELEGWYLMNCNRTVRPI